jgi:hypothetical protein
MLSWLIDVGVIAWHLFLNSVLLIALCSWLGEFAYLARLLLIMCSFSLSVIWLSVYALSGSFVKLVSYLGVWDFSAS